MTASGDGQSVDSASVHKSALVLDAHADIVLPSTLPQYLASDGQSKVAPTKLQAGGNDAVVMSIAVGPGPRNADGLAQAQAAADEKLAAFNELLSSHTGTLVLVRTADEIEAAKADGRIALIMGFQNARLIGTDLDGLNRYHDLGACVFGLTHMGHNDFADSSRPVRDPLTKVYQPVEEHGGLSDLGRAAVARLNHLGGVVDVSQLSHAATLETVALSKAPVIASHSNVKAISDVTRNLSDEEIDSIGTSGGVIHVAAFSVFLMQLNDPQVLEKVRVTRLAAGLPETYSYPFELYWELTDPEVRDTFVTTMRGLMKDISLADMIDHVDYLANRIGVDHIGIGNDFNHGTSIPGYEDASDAENVTHELLKRGYSPADIEKIWGGNFLRVMRTAQAQATL